MGERRAPYGVPLFTLRWMVVPPYSAATVLSQLTEVSNNCLRKDIVESPLDAEKLTHRKVSMYGGSLSRVRVQRGLNWPTLYACMMSSFQATTSLKCKPISLSKVLSKNAERLIGLKSLGEMWELSLTFQALGLYSLTTQLTKIGTNQRHDTSRIIFSLVGKNAVWPGRSSQLKYFQLLCGKDVRRLKA